MLPSLWYVDVAHASASGRISWGSAHPWRRRGRGFSIAAASTTQNLSRGSSPSALLLQEISKLEMDHPCLIDCFGLKSRRGFRLLFCCDCEDTTLHVIWGAAPQFVLKSNQLTYGGINNDLWLFSLHGSSISSLLFSSGSQIEAGRKARHWPEDKKS